MKMLILASVAACLAASVSYAEVVVIVHPKTRENTVTTQEAANIFLGRQSLLAQGTRVTPVDQEEGTAVRDAFYRKSADKNAAQIRAHWATVTFTGRGTPPLTAADSYEVRNIVATTPGMMGYIDASEVDDSVKVVLTLP